MRIALLAFPRVQMLDVVGPADVFAEAARQLGNSRAYRISVISTVAGQIKEPMGFAWPRMTPSRRSRGLSIRC